MQCGVCTPGFLVAAKSLLDRNPDPTETEVRYWLAGNLCRCTGYDKIVRAVLDAAAEMRGGDRVAVAGRFRMRGIAGGPDQRRGRTESRCIPCKRRPLTRSLCEEAER